MDGSRISIRGRATIALSALLVIGRAGAVYFTGGAARRLHGEMAEIPGCILGLPGEIVRECEEEGMHGPSAVKDRA